MMYECAPPGFIPPSVETRCRRCCQELRWSCCINDFDVTWYRYKYFVYSRPNEYICFSCFNNNN